MKKLLWTSALALCAVACITACDESSSSNHSAGVPTYKNAAALPDSCEMEAAKVDTVYYACFENEWIAVDDSATIEKIKEGLDEEDLRKELRELQGMLSSAAAQKEEKKSSSSGAAGTDEDEDDDIESSSEKAGEETGDSSSSSEKKSDESSSSEGDDESSSSEGDVGSSSANGDVESSSSATVEYKCGTVSYDPETQVCEEGNVIKGKCGTVTYELDGTQTCVGNVVKGVCGSSTYELDGTQTCVNNVVKGVCGSATYDLNGTRTCENGVLKGLCDGVSYDLQTRTCQYGEIVGKCGTATYDLESEVCVSGEVKGKCGSQAYDKETQGCCGSTVYDLDARFCNNNELLDYCGDQSLFRLYNQETQVCRTRDATVINKADKGTCGNDIYDTSNEICDTRGNTTRTYKTVKIGYGRAVLQTWMAENLNYNTSSGSKCYGNTSSNCDKYGRLYTWSTAKTACPTGWHLPTGEDIETLIVNADTMITSYSQNRQSGANLKGGEGWSNYWFDMYGFTALPAGYSTGSSFMSLGSEAYFWSSSDTGTGSAYYMRLSDDQNSADIGSMSPNNYASVRCIKD